MILEENALYIQVKSFGSENIDSGTLITLWLITVQHPVEGMARFLQK
jgi:hypothetical protein